MRAEQEQEGNTTSLGSNLNLSSWVFRWFINGTFQNYKGNKDCFYSLIDK